MPVYIIRAGEHGPCKIGFSRNITKRLVEMQTCNHERLTILRLFEGGKAEEAQLHTLFADGWLHGEWHSYTKAMLGDVGLVEVFDEPKLVPALPPPDPALPPADPASEDHFAEQINDLTRQWTERREREEAARKSAVSGQFVEVFEELTKQWRARREAAE